ncbi:MAG: FISUMP domain-containing protein, partial [Ignavibacteriaceae bacterium]
TLGAAVNNNGNALKAIGQGSGDGAGTNTSGFSALLAGYRGIYRAFDGLGYYADFWSSTETKSADAYALVLGSTVSGITLGINGKADGFSVRCVKE